MSYILFVCAQNRNRSIACEYRLRQILSDRKDIKPGEIEVHSAACGWPTIDYNKMREATGHEPEKNTYGVPPSPFMIQSMKRRGLDISQSISKKLNQDMVNKADLIVVFSKPYEDLVLTNFPDSKGKIYILQELAGYTGYIANIVIPDGSVVFSNKTNSWVFSEWYIEGCVTEVDHMLWWSVDKILDLARKKK